MALILSEEMEMLRASAQGFLGKAAPVSQLRQLRDDKSEDGFDRKTWSQMAELGWSGILVPEDHEGAGMGVEAAGLLSEEMGRTLTASPFLSTAILGATALSHAGSDAQKSQWLTKIADGSALLALASDEGRHHAPHHIQTRATRSGNGFSISGQKSFVTDAGTADAMIVAARTAGDDGDRSGITLFLVPTDANGLTKTRRDMIDSRHVAKVDFDNVEVTADAVLGEVDGGGAVLDRVLNIGRACLAAEMSGAAQECLKRTTAYLQEREQFGTRIGAFQGLQHRAAHLYTEVELGRSILMQALRMLDADPENAELLTHAAKAKLGEVAILAAQESIQMHGGIGMTDEFDIGFFIKRIRVADATFGDRHFHTDKFAQLRGY